VGGRIAGGAHVVVAANLDAGDRAQLAFLDDAVAGFNQMRRAAALRADLHDAPVLARRRLRETDIAVERGEQQGGEHRRHHRSHPRSWGLR
jgi:hypothetical protein